MLARGAALLCHIDINWVNAADRPLGPSIQKHAALPSIVGTTQALAKSWSSLPVGLSDNSLSLAEMCGGKKKEVRSHLQINHDYKPEKERKKDKKNFNFEHFFFFFYKNFDQKRFRCCLMQDYSRHFGIRSKKNPPNMLQTPPSQNESSL